jgi:hypothetical protein
VDASVRFVNLSQDVSVYRLILDSI